MLELEVRSAGELRSNGRTLYGHAARFNSEANLGHFVEIIRPGAFRKSLDAGTNVRALYDHESSALLGTTRGGTFVARRRRAPDKTPRQALTVGGVN